MPKQQTGLVGCSVSSGHFERYRAPALPRPPYRRGSVPATSGPRAGGRYPGAVGARLGISENDPTRADRGTVASFRAPNGATSAGSKRVSATGLAAPHLEGGRHAHQRPPVLGEPAQLGDYVVHLAVGDKPGAHSRLPYVLHRNLRHPLALAVAEGWHDQSDARLHQPGL